MSLLSNQPEKSTQTQNLHSIIRNRERTAATITRWRHSAYRQVTDAVRRIEDQLTTHQPVPRAQALNREHWILSTLALDLRTPQFGAELFRVRNFVARITTNNQRLQWEGNA